MCPPQNMIWICTAIAHFLDTDSLVLKLAIPGLYRESPPSTSLQPQPELGLSVLLYNHYQNQDCLYFSSTMTESYGCLLLPYIQNNFRGGVLGPSKIIQKWVREEVYFVLYILELWSSIQILLLLQKLRLVVLPQNALKICCIE